MDRELTGKEKIQQRKKSFRPNKNRPPGSVRISYRALIVWSVLVSFLFLPFLVDYGIKTFGISLYVDEGSRSTPNPEQYNAPILQVYTARTWGLKGMFAVHSWIVMKPRGAKNYEVSQVIGWRQGIDGNVLFRETNVPINSWWGKEATLMLDLRGDSVEFIIDKVEAAIDHYPWKQEYTMFPGPNSNTFVAWIGLKVPELGLDLPSTAIGKDWRPLENSLGSSSSGSGIQASLFGLLGTSIGFEEGLEVNILGLNFELDLFDLALEIPLFGRFEVWYLLCYMAIWPLVQKWIKRTKSKYLYLI